LFFRAGFARGILPVANRRESGPVSPVVSHTFKTGLFRFLSVTVNDGTAMGTDSGILLIHPPGQAVPVIIEPE